MTRLTALVAIIILTLIIVAACTPAHQIPQSTADSQVHGDSEEHDFSVEIEGSEMKKLTINQIASLWEIDAQRLLDNIVAKFNLKHEYNTNSTLDELRNENKFTPSQVKEIAESMKKEIAD